MTGRWIATPVTQARNDGDMGCRLAMTKIYGYNNVYTLGFMPYEQSHIVLICPVRCLWISPKLLQPGHNFCYI